MNEREQTLFYAGGIFLDLDSCEIDAILADAGLSVERDNVEECRAAIRSYIGEDAWVQGMDAGRRMFNGHLTVADAERRGIELVTIAEAARLRGITVQAISGALNRGALTTYMDPEANERQGRRLVDRAEL